jgi:hypothetical protein
MSVFQKDDHGFYINLGQCIVYKNVYNLYTLANFLGLNDYTDWDFLEMADGMARPL